MNIKLALTALICSVAMSCSVSEGQLLDRMLSKVGCNVCESASPCDTGCDTGCGGEMISECGAVESCGCGGGGLGILDKIKDRLGKVGCGGGCEAAAEPCGCAAPVVESCGCDAAPSCGGGGISLGGGGLGLLDRMKGRLSSMGSGCGCEAPAPVMMAAPSCGCDAAPSCGGSVGIGLMDKIQGRVSSLGSRVSSIGGGCGAPAGDCGCNAAPVMAAPAPCASACDAEPSCGGGGLGLLDRLKGRLSSVGSGGGCGCAAAPVATDCGCSAPAPAPCTAPVVESCGSADGGCGINAGGRIRGALSGITSRVGSIGSSSDCGCSAPAPVADCGCSAGGGRVRGALGSIRSRVGSIGSSSDCGCSAPVADCGCGSGAGSARARLSLLDRLRGNRIARDKSGRVIGGGCNDGCNSPCPKATSDCGCGAAAPVSSGCSACGDSTMAAPVSTGCSACGDSIMAAPVAGAVIYDDSSSMNQGVIMETPVDSAPAATQEAVIEAAPAASQIDETPAVDPNAFIIRKGNIRS